MSIAALYIEILDKYTHKNSITYMFSTLFKVRKEIQQNNI